MKTQTKAALILGAPFTQHTPLAPEYCCPEPCTTTDLMLSPFCAKTRIR